MRLGSRESFSLSFHAGVLAASLSTSLCTSAPRRICSVAASQAIQMFPEDAEGDARAEPGDHVHDDDPKAMTA